LLSQDQSASGNVGVLGLVGFLNKSFAEQVSYAKQNQAKMGFNAREGSSQLLHVMQSFPLSSIKELQRI
jgi:hypothetical protein